MIDKSFYVVMFVYACSFGFLGIQFVLGDTFGITISNAEGTPLTNNILSLLNTDTINSVTSALVNANNTRNDTLSAIENAYNIGFNVAWQIILLLTGTYIFGVLSLLGVPTVVIAGMVLLYMFFLARTIIALIRGL